MADTIVNTLTNNNVLGKVLPAAEWKVLSDYFDGARPLDDEVLNLLNKALERILDRAPEFYDNKEELKKVGLLFSSLKRCCLSKFSSWPTGTTPRRSCWTRCSRATRAT